ncbi:MAG: CARDB domain-containing protein, partial [Kiritimatiellia bacterium]
LVTGGREQLSLVNPGGIREDGVSAGLKIPNATAPGVYYLGVLLDEYDEVEESNKANNTAVQVIEIVPAPLPDLSVASFTGPAQANPGEVIGSVVDLVVTNAGSVAAGAFSVGIYLSTDAVIATNDTLLIGGREQSLLGLNPESSWGLGVSTQAKIPPGTPAGVYYLGVLLDEYDEVEESNKANNTAKQVIEIVPAPGADLSVQSFYAPLQAAPGDVIGPEVALVSENVGVADAPTFYVGVYLSSNPEITTNDMLLTRGSDRVGELPAGQSRTESLPLDMAIPAGLDPGPYYIGVLLDELNQVSELVTSNNFAARVIQIASDPSPDLYVLGFNAFGETQPEQPMFVEVFVGNQGTLATTNFSAGIYLSEDHEITREDYLLFGGREAVKGIGAGGSAAVNFDEGIYVEDIGLPNGLYYLGVLVDDSDDVDELNESNNYASKPVILGPLTAPRLTLGAEQDTTLTLQTQSGFSYQLQSSTNLNEPDWSPYGDTVPGNGDSIPLSLPMNQDAFFMRAVEVR